MKWLMFNYYKMLGDFYTWKGKRVQRRNYKEAEECFKRAVELDPTNERFKSDLAEMQELRRGSELE